MAGCAFQCGRGWTRPELECITTTEERAVLITTCSNAQFIAIAVFFMGFVLAPSAVRAQEDGDDEATENTSAACRDGSDNDGDAHIDCDDQDCWEFVFCESTASRMGDEAAETAGGSAEDDSDGGDAGESSDEAAVVDGVEQERGRGALVTGVVFASLGTLCLATGGLMALAWDEADAWYTASIALFGIGGAQLLAGVILSAVGGAMMRRTREDSPSEEARRSLRTAFLAPVVAPTVGGGLLLGISGVFR